jgi:hypothetical protein
LIGGFGLAEMIVTERFVYLHLHKSGGSFVSNFLLGFLPSAERVGYHYPMTVIPASCSARPVLGSVRNPWEVYVSYYFFQLALLKDVRQRLAQMSAEDLDKYIAAGNDPFNGVDVLFELMSDGGLLGFTETTSRMMRLGVDDALLDKVLDQMPTTFNERGRSTPRQVDGFRGMNVRAQDLATIRGAGEGLYSFLFRHLYGDGHGVAFLQQECLRDALLAYLVSRDIELTPEMVSYVRDAERANVSRHGAAANYYDAGLAATIGQRDGALIDRFGYSFELDSEVGA